MTHRERVQGEIKKEELRNLWQKICDAYVQGGVEQIKSTLVSRIDEIRKDYKQQLENLNKML
jgi:ABC-type transporter Mla MlaB component